MGFEYYEPLIKVWRNPQVNINSDDKENNNNNNNNNLGNTAV